MNIPQPKVKALTDALRGGSDLDTACQFAGLSTNQVLKFLEQGKLEAERISAGIAAQPALADTLEFWENLKKARADAIVRNVAALQKAANDGQWQAAAWWLERTVPEQYAKRTAKPAKEVKSSGGGQITE
jgi:hypothetical protein